MALERSRNLAMYAGMDSNIVPALEYKLEHILRQIHSE